MQTIICNYTLPRQVIKPIHHRNQLHVVPPKFNHSFAMSQLDLPVTQIKWNYVSSTESKGSI
jgi:hypothetical protein